MICFKMIKTLIISLEVEEVVHYSTLEKCISELKETALIPENPLIINEHTGISMEG